jgi:hypothetical protein
MATSSLRTLKIMPGHLNEIYVHEFGFSGRPAAATPLFQILLLKDVAENALTTKEEGGKRGDDRR